MDSKKRRIISYEKMTPDIQAAFAEKYKGGKAEAFQDLTRYTKPDGTPFYAVMVEIPDAICLIKIQVEVDDADDLERWLEGEEEAEAEQVAGTNVAESETDATLPDDNINQYNSDSEDKD